MNESSTNSFISEEAEKPKLLENIMVQTLDKKKTLDINIEIKKRKKMFNGYLKTTLGPDFIKIKPESYLELVEHCKTFYFSPESKFLNNFPKLKSKIIKERKINNNKLLTKIDVGSLLYLDEARKKKYLDKNDQKNERLMAFSKNFSTKYSKDVISNEIIKVTFWEKNKKKINKVLKNKFAKIFQRFFSQGIENNDNNNIEENVKKENLIVVNNYIDEDENYENLKENNRYNPIRTYFNNVIKLKKGKNKLEHIDVQESDEIVKESYNNINSLKDSSFPSILNNTNSMKTFSNEKEKIYNLKSLNTISRNSKILEIKKNAKTSFNSSLRTALKSFQTSNKYKKNIKDKVLYLNSQTHLCNNRLFKLINNNQTILPKNQIKNEDKDFDINYSLSETSKYFSKWKKNNKGTFSYLSYEKLNSTNAKKLKGQKINEIIKEAKNNMSSEGKFKKRELKLFPKRIFEISDDYALEMVDRLFSKDKIKRQRMPEIKETVKEIKEAKEHKNINVVRNRAKNNHDKIIRMGFYLEREKEKFLIKNNKKHFQKRIHTEVENNKLY